LNVGIHHQLGKVPPVRAAVAAAMAAAITTVAGCSAAPAGAVNDSPAIGPVRTGAAVDSFPAFQVPESWPGAGGVRYTALMSPQTSTVKREFSITVTPGLAFWLACITIDGNSSGGTARIVSTSIGLNWTTSCGTDPDPAGITFAPPHATVGHKVKITVTSTAHTRWLVRADGSSTRPNAATPAKPVKSA
jgi:hypothetical protein